MFGICFGIYCVMLDVWGFVSKGLLSRRLAFKVLAVRMKTLLSEIRDLPVGQQLQMKSGIDTQGCRLCVYAFWKDV